MTSSLNRTLAAFVMMLLLSAGGGLYLTQRVAGAQLAHVAGLPALASRPAVTVTLDTAVFAGGCFWGIQSVFQHVKGVKTATSGYAGGTVANPKYEQVGTGRSGHAESVQVVFDPSEISYGTLMQIFFSVAHDPTQLNRQGPDVGTQYRSAIFYRTPEQKRAAEAYIDQLDKSGHFDAPIVTQVAPLSAFYRAEEYHQNYAELHPNELYIIYNDVPKVENLKRVFAKLYTDKLAGN